MHSEQGACAHCSDMQPFTFVIIVIIMIIIIAVTCNLTFVITVIIVVICGWDDMLLFIMQIYNACDKGFKAI